MLWRCQFHALFKSNQSVIILHYTTVLLLYNTLHVSHNIRIHLESYIIKISYSFAYIHLQNASWQAVMSAMSKSVLKCKVLKCSLKMGHRLAFFFSLSKVHTYSLRWCAASHIHNWIILKVHWYAKMLERAFENEDFFLSDVGLQSFIGVPS